MPKQNRNDCKNNGEHTVLTYYQLQFNTRCQKCCVQKSQMGYSRKKSKKGGGVGWGQLEFSAITACQVPASYQPLATNKALLALFSLFTNAIS